MSAPVAALEERGQLGERLLPVIEVFGPTIQGEGPDAGLRCYFVRLGYCDYRCSWCDSMFAVEPAEVREHAVGMSAEGIAERLANLEVDPQPADLIVLSGGNPALFDLTHLVEALRRRRWKVAVETQGSRFREWLLHVNRLVVSPKPPSSGMATEGHERRSERFLERVTPARAMCGGVLKVVVFDETDLSWARVLHRAWPTWPFYLSVGTPTADERPDPLWAISNRLQWLMRRSCECDDLADVRVLPQLHVVAYGHRRAV